MKKDYGSFFILGKPRPQPRPRCVTRGGMTWAYNAESTSLRVWKLATKWGAKQLGVKFGAGESVGVKIVLHLRSKVRADLDNYAKAMLDAMTGAGLWVDDSQVDKLEISRRLVEKSDDAGASVFVWRIVTDPEEAARDDNRISMKDVARIAAANAHRGANN